MTLAAEAGILYVHVCLSHLGFPGIKQHALREGHLAIRNRHKDRGPFQFYPCLGADYPYQHIGHTRSVVEDYVRIAFIAERPLQYLDGDMSDGAQQWQTQGRLGSTLSGDLLLCNIVGVF